MGCWHLRGLAKGATSCAGRRLLIALVFIFCYSTCLSCHTHVYLCISQALSDVEGGCLYHKKGRKKTGSFGNSLGLEERVERQLRWKVSSWVIKHRFDENGESSFFRSYLDISLASLFRPLWPCSLEHSCLFKTRPSLLALSSST